MESLALMVSIVLAAYTFIAGFVGFVVGDNFEGYWPGISGAIIPGLCVGFYFSMPFAFAWWLVAYTGGYGIGYLFRSVKP